MGPLAGESLSVKSLAVMFLLAAALRLSWYAAEINRSGDPDQLRFDDEVWYWRMATSIHDGHGLVGEFGHRAPRMPLYPVFLSWFAGSGHGIAWAKTVQALLGAAAAALVAGLAGSIAGKRGGWLAGLLVAIDPLLIGVGTLLLTETLFVALLAGIAWSLHTWIGDLLRAHRPQDLPSDCGVRPRAAAFMAPVLSVAAAYTRPSAIPVVLALAGWPILASGFHRRTIRVFLFIAISMTVALLPWGWRNYRLTGRFTLLDHRAGITLYDGVGPQATGASDLGAVKAMPAVRDLSEAEWDGWFRREAWRAVREDPGRIARLALVKMQRMWSPVLNAKEYQSSVVRIAAAAWAISWYALILAGLVSLRHSWRLATWLLLPASMLSLVHALYIGSVRYRLGAVPTLTVIAGLGLNYLAARPWRRTSAT